MGKEALTFAIVFGGGVGELIVLQNCAHDMCTLFCKRSYYVDVMLACVHNIFTVWEGPSINFGGNLVA